MSLLPFFTATDEARRPKAKGDINMQKEEKLFLKCPKCDSKNLYTLTDKTHVCRRCANRWKEDLCEK
jgi:ribosomal protein L37AE/L43A